MWLSTNRGWTFCASFLEKTGFFTEVIGRTALETGFLTKSCCTSFKRTSRAAAALPPRNTSGETPSRLTIGSNATLVSRIPHRFLHPRFDWLQSGSPKQSTVDPAAVTTYCFASIAYVIGEAFHCAPGLICQSGLPVCACTPGQFPPVSP